MKHSRTKIYLIFLLVYSYIFYRWGFKNYKEAWYLFDQEDEIFTVIRNVADGWETIEIPYEEVDSIDWLNGGNGKAIIKSHNFEFETNRASEKRKSSITELWNALALIDTKMENWPVTLRCQNCTREFGHHIGTAQCPFCEIILEDTKSKGRIDPKGTHPDDVDRI